MSTKVYMYKDTQIDTHIGEVETIAGKLQDKIHALATSTFFVLSKAGKGEKSQVAARVAVDRLNRLQGASPYHAKAFAKWMSIQADRLGYLHWSDETKAWYVDLAFNGGDLRLSMDEFTMIRDGKRFWEVSPPSKPNPLDNLASLILLDEKTSKHVITPKENDVIDLELMREVRTAIEKAKARQKVA